LDTLYGHLSNLSQETAMILPEGYELEFVVPSGSPEVFKNLIEYIDKEISLVICGEDEAGQAEAGSRASSQVANTIRVVRASEISEMLSQTLTQTLVRWIVDLNFGMDVAAPYLTREFRIEESPLTMPDVSLLIQSGYTPRKEWIERHFRVELEEKSQKQEAEEGTTFDPQQDQDLFGSIFGDEAGAQPSPQQEQAAAGDVQEAGQDQDPFDSIFGNEGEQPSPQQEQAAAGDIQEAADTMEMPAGAAPEEGQSDAIDEPTPEEQLGDIEGGQASPETSLDEELDYLWDNEPEESISDEEEKPFGNQKISEDEAVEMDRK
jgi:hypothetical protein